MTYTCRYCERPIIFRWVTRKLEDGTEVPNSRRRAPIHVEGGGCVRSVT